MSDPMDQDLEAFTDSISTGRPVWVESEDRTVWLAHDPMSGLKLQMIRRTTGLRRTPWWAAYATNSDGLVATPVACGEDLNAALHIAENMAARGRFNFPTTDMEIT